MKCILTLFFIISFSFSQSLFLEKPKYGETMTPDDLVEISWSFENLKSNQKNIKISYSFNGKNWIQISEINVYEKSYFWLVPKILIIQMIFTFKFY